MVWRATESAERILKKRNCSPCRRSHAVGFSNASRDSSLKRLFISIYFMPRNHLFSEYSANYKTRRRIERTEAERCNFLFLFALRERSFDPDSSFSRDQLISNELWGRQLRTRKSFSYRCFISLPPARYFPLFLRPRTRLVLRRRSSRLLDRPASCIVVPPCLLFPLYHSHGAF